MGQATRNYDWDNSELGPPSSWPQNLKLTLSTLLNSKFPMFLWWGENLIQFYNDAYRPSLGNDGKHGKALGQRGKDCWPEIWDIIFPLITRVREHGEATWNENQLIPIYRNGKIEDVWWTFGYSPVYSEDYKKVNGVLVVCTETTETMKAGLALAESEKRLRASEGKLRSLIHAAPPAIGLFVGRDLIVEMPNKSFIEVVGKGSDIEGKPLREVMPELEKEGQPFLKILDEVYTTGKMFQSEASQVNIYRNGHLTENFYNITYSPLYDENGKIFAILDIAVDVTGEVKAKQQIVKSEKHLRNIILQAPVAMAILIGPEQIVEIANERMYELWGKPEKDLIGKSLFVGLPEVANQGFEKLLNDVFTTGERYSAQSVPVDLPRNGKKQKLYVSFVYEPYRNTEGEMAGVMVVAYDVTPLVYAQQRIEEVVTLRTSELAETNLRLQSSNRELEQFAYIASHDLQEPLRKVTTYAHLLKSRLGSLGEKEGEFLEKVVTSATRMQTLIKNVLQYSAVGSIENFQPVDLNTIVDDILIDLELAFEQSNAVLQRNGLPVLEAVSTQMTQLFFNLISNSLKFARAGIPPQITISTQPLSKEHRDKTEGLNQDRDYVLITFSDNGIGFDEKYAERNFHNHEWWNFWFFDVDSDFKCATICDFRNA